MATIDATPPPTGPETPTLAEERRERHPLLTGAGWERHRYLREHPHAPRWTTETGDRLTAGELAGVERFRAALWEGRFPRPPGWIPPPILEWLEERHPRIPWLRRRLPPGWLTPGGEGGAELGEGVAQAWAGLPTTSRETLATTPELLVPDDLPLERMIIYRTAGTTGHPLLVPHHPEAVSCYPVLLAFALGRWGIHPDWTASPAGCILVGAQSHTVTCAAVLAAWGGCGFAKINLHPEQWRDPADRSRFLADLDPPLITGDPLSLAQLLQLDPPIRPRALVSTAVALNPVLRQRLEERFGCPVIQWYSLTETGPIGYGCPRGEGYHLLPHDLHLEVLDSGGGVLPPGERGEITVSGGRNPFVPLVRYRTGDWGSVDHRPCGCGDPMPRIRGLEGRQPVRFRDAAGGEVNSVDLARLLREFPLLQHHCMQRRDHSLVVRLRPITPGGVDVAVVRERLRTLLGAGMAVEVVEDGSLGERGAGGKITAFASELLWE